MTLPVLQQRPRCPMTSFAILWWTPNATQWIPATPPSTSPRHNMRQRTPTVTAAAVAPCQGACADRCPARDASMMRTGMVSRSPAVLQQQPPPESVRRVFHLCRCAHPAYSPDSGECKRPAGKDPSSWGVEEVVSFIKDADPQALGPHTDAFRKHVSRSSFILDINGYDRTKYMAVWALGRETPGDWVLFNLNFFYKAALFIHKYPSPRSLQSWI